MTLSDFIGINNGRKLDYDKFYGAQCVDLYRFYLKDVLRVPQSPAVKGAADLWVNYRSQDFLRIPNTPLGIPQPGDVMIWNRNTGAGAGHVAIVKSASLMWFDAFSQNDPAGSVSHVKRYTYRNVYGWLRPRKGASPAAVVKGDDILLSDIRAVVNGSVGSPSDRIKQIREILK